MGPQKRVVFFIFFSLLSLSCRAQDEWNIPWIVVGDSTKSGVGQQVIVTGIVTLKGSKQPLSGSLVSVDYLKHFDYSDDQGRYFLEMPAGNYRFLIKHLGAKPAYYRVKVFSNGVLNVEMEEGTLELETVIINSRPIDSNIKESLAGLTKLSMTEVKTLPALLGEVDIVKSLQLMPGVSSVGEGSSGFNVRGGRTDQNLITLNDVPLFNSSHALGFISVFNQDIVNTFSLYKGNVPAYLGGRAASALEINTRRGDFEKWKFQGGAGVVTSRFTAEGPINVNKTSILVSGRIAYPDWILRKVEDPEVNKSSASFHDAFLALSHRFTTNSLADITLYSSHDSFTFSDLFGYDWKNNVVNARWQGLTNRALSPTISIAYSNFQNSLIDPSGVDASVLTNALNYLQVKTKLQYEPDDNHFILAGVEALGYFPKQETRQGYNGNVAIPKQTVEKNNGLEFSIFAQDDYKFSENISVSAGLRYSVYSHLGTDTAYRYATGLPKSISSIIDTTHYSELESIKTFGGLEPRISARISLSSNQSLKISYNRMRQYIHQISNSAAPTPVDIWQVSNEYLPPQIADNYSLGYFLNIKDNRWETSAEIFYKDLKNLVEYKDFPVLFLNRHLETELLSGIGRAHGGELYIRRLKGRYTGWLSYTYSQTRVKVSSPIRSESINDGNWYPSNYNKPHNFNFVLNKRLQREGAFSLIISYNTGRPFTAVESSYIVGSTVVPVYSNRNEYRMQNYLRVDISITAGNVVKKLNDSLVFSIYNLFGRDNAYSVFYRRPASNFLVPKPYKLSVLGSALPSITYNFKF